MNDQNRPFTRALMSAVALPVLLLGVSACSKPTTEADVKEKAKPRTAAAPWVEIDPCSLLTKEEIQTLQGEALSEAKASKPESRDFAVGQCFFALPTNSKSIVLTLTQPAPGGAGMDPREFWEETFEKEHEEKGEEGEKKAPPQKIEGLGDEAYWLGNRISGALYILRGNAFLRIGTGTPEAGTDSLAHAKTIGAAALKHLEAARPASHAP